MKGYSIDCGYLIKVKDLMECNEVLPIIIVELGFDEDN